MTKPEALRMMRLLSAIESALMMAGKPIPDLLCDEITTAIEVLEREILGEDNGE
jgi:hypothetical protein